MRNTKWIARMFRALSSVRVQTLVQEAQKTTIPSFTYRIKKRQNKEDLKLFLDKVVDGLVTKSSWQRESLGQWTASCTRRFLELLDFWFRDAEKSLAWKPKANLRSTNRKDQWTEQRQRFQISVYRQEASKRECENRELQESSRREEEPVLVTGNNESKIEELSIRIKPGWAISSIYKLTERWVDLGGKVPRVCPWKPKEERLGDRTRQDIALSRMYMNWFS